MPNYQKTRRISNTTIFVFRTLLIILMAAIMLLSACKSERPKDAFSESLETLRTVEKSDGGMATEESTVIQAVSVTPDKIQEIIDQDRTRQANFTETPMPTPTLEATPIPEATPTPQSKALPDSISFDRWQQTERSNPLITDRSGYRMLGLPIKFRPEDIHYDEPFSMLNGRYYVQVWADAWFQEKVRNANGEYEDGPAQHITVPVMVYDTQKHALWRIGQQAVADYSQNPPSSKELLIEGYTGPASESGFVEAQINMMCLTDNGNRSCGEIYSLYIGPDSFPPGALNSGSIRTSFFPNLEFWQDLIEGVYTQEKVDQYAETLDLSLFKLDLEQDLPKNFIIPIVAE